MARRFFGQKSNSRQRRASAPAIRIATAGIAIGLAVMIVSVAVVKGFQHEVKHKITGFASHIDILDINSLNSPEDYPIVAPKSFVEAVRNTPGVAHVQRTSEKMGILKTNDDFAGIQLKGIGSDYDTKFLKSALTDGDWPAFEDTVASNKIVLSRYLAQRLHLKVGSRVYAYFFESTVKMRRFEVAAIYETNLNQFDKLFVIGSSATVSQLNSWQADQCSSLEVVTTDFDRMDQTQQRLTQLIAQEMKPEQGTYEALSVRENPRTSGTFQWLELLDFNVWIILILMVAVAGFTMVSGLLILILERTSTIGVLKALGATNTRVRHVFLYYAALIIGRGLIIGNVLGLGVVWAQANFGFAHLDPATYYVDAVPVMLSAWWVVALNVGTLLITFLALVGPSFLITRIQPARAIRFD